MARTVGGELQQYLSQRLELVADDVRADLSAAISTFEGADATAGQTARTIGLALAKRQWPAHHRQRRLLLAVALVNSWNPAGWILGAVASSAAWSSASSAESSARRPLPTGSAP